MRIRAAMVLRSLVLTLALVNAAYAQVPPDVAKSSAELAAKQAEAIAQAQAKVAEESRRQAEARANAITPIDIEVVVSRYQGDKKVSSLPYLLSVNASDRQEKTSLRMGASVPVRNATFAPASSDGKAPAGPITYNYQDIGTNIDCSARQLGDGRFVVSLSVGERSIVEGAPDAPGSIPVVRNFTSANNLVLRDGQTRQFTAASDRISGEVVKIDVTLKIVK